MPVADFLMNLEYVTTDGKKEMTSLSYIYWHSSLILEENV